MAPRPPPLQPNRDSVTTIAEDGSRNFLRPADVSGPFTFWRRVSALFLIAVYIALPWIPINGAPAVFLDVASRRFHFFGFTLATEDLWFLFFGLTGLGFLLFFVTAVFGRLWCGWACPQTIFLEHVFRRVERLFEGPAAQQKALDRQDWNAEKVLRRGGKHLVFVLIAAVIAHIFLSYFISVDALFAWLGEGPGAHPRAFVFMLVMTVILYFNFSWFREQLCLIICPYGRLQSALIDDDSIIIGYDENRGEPRGKASDPDAGDCVACNRCVEVCPTGIDIRQGLQMECIGCANCIDACDAIMKKLKREPGLIRYDSLQGLAGRKRRILRPRLFLYLFLMLLGAGAMAYSATKIQPVSMTLSRMTGAPFFVDEDTVRNQLQIRLINKRSEPIALDIRAHATEENGIPLETSGYDQTLLLEPLAETRRPFVVRIPREAYAGSFQLTVHAEADDGALDVVRTIDFLGPDPRLLREDGEARQ